MMRLSTMQEVVKTVDAQWESPLANKILQQWTHDFVPAKYWRASANFVFFCKWLGQEYVLRFNHTDERSAEIIQAEVAFVNELACAGICVAKPVQSLAGNYVETVATDSGVFHAVVFEVLKGKQLELDDLEQNDFIQWGKALGELHNAAAQSSVTGRPTWQDHLAMVSNTLPSNEVAALKILSHVEEQLEMLAKNDDNFGLIHFDFELDNIIWNGTQAGIIDFDDSALYWFVADIAFTLRDLFDDRVENVDFQNISFSNFIKGYRSVRVIDEAELRLIPLFLRMHNLISFAKLHRTLTPINPAGELPWMAELRDKLAKKMVFYRHEFSL